jgi:hypothetical protein
MRFANIKGFVYLGLASGLLSAACCLAYSSLYHGHFSGMSGDSLRDSRNAVLLCIVACPELLGRQGGKVRGPCRDNILRSDDGCRISREPACNGWPSRIVPWSCRTHAPVPYPDVACLEAIFYRIEKQVNRISDRSMWTRAKQDRPDFGIAAGAAIHELHVLSLGIGYVGKGWHVAIEVLSVSLEIRICARMR